MTASTRYYEYPFQHLRQPIAHFGSLRARHFKRRPSPETVDLEDCAVRKRLDGDPNHSGWFGR